MPRTTTYNWTLNRPEWIAFHSFCNYRTVTVIGDQYIWSHNAELADTAVVNSLVEKGLVEKVKPTKYATAQTIFGLARNLLPKKRP